MGSGGGKEAAPTAAQPQPQQPTHQPNAVVQQQSSPNQSPPTQPQPPKQPTPQQTVEISPQNGDAKNATTADDSSDNKQNRKRDGRWYPVVLTSGSLLLTGADHPREATLGVKLDSGDQPFIPDEDVATTGGSSNSIGKFSIPAKKQKLVSFFASGGEQSIDASPTSATKAYTSTTIAGGEVPLSSVALTTQWQRESAVVCVYEERRWRTDRVNLVLCLTVLDSDGNRIQYEQAVNLLEAPVDNIVGNTKTTSMDFTSGFGLSSKKIASFEFSFQILFDAVGKNGGALLRLSASPLQIQFPQIFAVSKQLVSALNDLAVTNVNFAEASSLKTTDEQVQDLMDVLDVLATSSKITFLKNKLQGKELSDKYRDLCKTLIATLLKSGGGHLIDSVALLTDVDVSANSVVNMSAQFFDNILTVRDSGRGKQDVTSFLERYKSSADEFARKGVEAGEAYSQLAAMLCDIAGLIEPLVSAAPFGMLVVEAIGVLFKLIAGRKDMMELCEKIASRLSIFLRVLQQSDVQALLRDDEATLDACVSVYIAIDDCSECIKGFHSNIVVIQLFVASERQAALQDCYDELHTQFEILHNVTSLRAMAAAKKHQATIEEKLESLLSMQQTMLLTCNGNSALLSRLAAAEDTMQDYLVPKVINLAPSEGDQTANFEALVEESVRQAICQIGNAQVHERIRRASLQHTTSTQISEDALRAVEASVRDAIDSVAAAGGKDMRPSDVAAFVTSSMNMILNSPAVPLALKANTPEALNGIKIGCDTRLLTALGETIENSFKKQTAQHQKTRAEMKKQFVKLEGEMKKLQSDTVTSIGDKIRDASASMSVEIRGVRDDVQALSVAVLNPLKMIEAHILQYTDLKALNKPLEIAPSELLRIGTTHTASLAPGQIRFTEARKALYRNRDVFVKTYSPQVDQSLRREEANSLFQLHHDRIVELVGTVVDGKNISEIVLEYLGGGALRGILEQQQHDSLQRLTREQRLVFMYDIIAGLNFLHSQSPPRVHTRLDLSNVVVTSDRRGAKLVDFKGSTNFNPSIASDNSHQLYVDPTHFLTGTAPELFRPTGSLQLPSTTDAGQQRPFSVASDTYAAGTTLYELWSGNIAFSGKRGNLLLKALRDGDEPFTAQDIKSLPPVIQAILIGLTHNNPARRISLGQILRMQENFGQGLLDAPINEWRDFLPAWCSHGGEDLTAASEHGMTLSIDNIPKFTKVQLRKYLNEKEIAPAIIERIVSKGYTAKQYLRTDFVFKAFPPDIRGEFDDMHLDSLSELHDFDSDYHSRLPVVGATAPEGGAATSAGTNAPSPLSTKVALSRPLQSAAAEASTPSAAGATAAGGSAASDRSSSSVVVAPQGPRVTIAEEYPLNIAAPSVRLQRLQSIDSTVGPPPVRIDFDASSPTFGKDVVSDDPSSAMTTATSGGFTQSKFMSRVQAIIARKKKFAGSTSQLDVNSFDSFFALAEGPDMQKQGYAVHNGAVLTKKECFRRALESESGGKLKSQRSKGWWMLASCMESAAETASVAGNHVTRKQCIVNTLECDNKHVDAWSLLTRIMGENETVVVPGKEGELSRRDCAVEAVLCNTQDPDAWVTLSSCLPRKELVSIVIPPATSAIQVDRKYCLIRAVKLNPTSARYWQLLSQAIGSKDDSVTITTAEGPVCITKLQAMAKSLSFDPTAGNIWLTIATQLQDDGECITVNNVEMNKRDCLVQAINNGASEGYNHLASLMGRHDTVKIHKDEKEVTKILAYCRGLEQDDSTYSMWNNLGVEMIYQKMYPPVTVNIGGHGDMNMTDIFICSIERDPSFGKHWNGLGISLKDDQVVTVLQRNYTKQQCYLKALAIIPDYMYAWNWLGMTLPSPTDTVVVNGDQVNKRDCFERAINLGWDYAYPWWNLALVMKKGETVALTRQTMTCAEVVRRAHALYPTDKDILALMAQHNFEEL